MRLATFRRIVLAAAWFALSCGGAAAQDPAAFFKGRTLRIVVGFGPGDGYDLSMRAQSRNTSARIFDCETYWQLRAPHPAAALRAASPAAPAYIAISARLIAACRVGEAIFAPSRSVT